MNALMEECGVFRRHSGWCEAPDRRCAMRIGGNLEIRVRCFASPENKEPNRARTNSPKQSKTNVKNLPSRRPHSFIVGVGEIVDRPTDIAAGLEPLTLLEQAVAARGSRLGAPS